MYRDVPVFMKGLVSIMVLYYKKGARCTTEYTSGANKGASQVSQRANARFVGAGYRYIAPTRGGILGSEIARIFS